MAKKQTMDHAQLLVLSLLAGEDMYGYQMIVELARRSDHTFEMKEGTLYPVLHGLERDGAVEAYQQEASTGRMRKYYRLTHRGAAVLREEAAAWQTYSGAVNAVRGWTRHDMDRRDYTDRVLSSLRRVTEKEREAIRSELDGHIEDHMEALRELGYDEELAEERAIAAMGEPDEVGRELNRQYTGWGWVLVSRAAVVLTVVLCAQALLALGILGMVIDSISARIYPNEPSAYTAVAATERLDIRIPVGNDILRVYRISIGQADDTPGVWEAEVQLCAYDRIPGGIVSRRLMEQTWLETPGGRRDPPKGSGRGNWRVEYGSCYVSLSPEDTYVVLRFEAFDEQSRLELPLPEQEGL